MRKPNIPLTPALYLQNLLHRRYISTTPNYPLLPTPPPPQIRRAFYTSNLHTLNPQFQTLIPFSYRSLSTQIDDENSVKIEEKNSIAESLSKEILKNPESEPLPLHKRLDLSFSHVAITGALLRDILDLSPDAGREILNLLKWAKSKPEFSPSDDIYSHFVNYFGRRKDFKAAHEVLVHGRGFVGAKSLETLIDRLVRAGREAQTVALFDRMEEDYGFSRNKDSLKLIVSSLCKRGYASYAEKMVKNLATEFFPDEYICDALINGWCVSGKLDEAKRLADEMYRGGFAIGTCAYNAILDCVCKLCREKDPFKLQSEADNVLIEMERNGVPRDVETFNVMITNLCKIRKTGDAMEVFDKMSEWGCGPNEITFLVLIKSLYQAARVGEGDEMIDRMKSAGYSLDKKAYYEFLKILCGIERIDHAMSVFEKMKGDGCKPGIKTYDLLMGKLCSYNRLDKANVLYKEAESSGVPVEPKQYRVDPKFVKKKKDTAVKKEKKRETLPEKMARKRRTLKKIRLSFVKKPKRSTRRAY